MKLGQLLEHIEFSEIRGDPQEEIKGLAYDSRMVQPGYVFVALRGQTLDGHRFIAEAVERGAVVVVVEDMKWVERRICAVQVTNTRRALSQLAVNFYRRPFEGMNLIGITGTNGKTSTSYLLESILLAAGAKPGVIGTVNYRFSGCTCKAPVTTPESLDLMHALRKMADGGVTDVVMEVSSHALDQDRVRDCPFGVAVFTNMSRDHLDYHHSMEAYFGAKSRLFRSLNGNEGDRSAKAVINTDDFRGKDLTKLTKVPVTTYGLAKDCAVKANNVRMTKNGLTAWLETPSGEVEVRSCLIGEFNVYNILAASAAALAMGIDLPSVAAGIERLEEVPGRLQRVGNERTPTIVVDYAHTPDALLKALRALKPLANNRLITVFGCGGDRDKGKRPEMGRVAGEYSDLIVITSDNPRTESPSTIVAQIEEGVRGLGLRKLERLLPGEESKRGYVIELDRRKAIDMAIDLANVNDVVLIAGKGHEDYQIVGAERREFDDREVARQALLKKRF
jgi:UDP-N-acetylmuramoyl-L-alanyl-D-glutamate--2,6-diaminopimelate ligase